MSAVPYPVSPASASGATLRVSPAFRRATARVMLAIVLFAILYVILLLISIGLGLAMIFSGVAIVISAPSFGGVLALVGLGGAGVLLLLFVLRFMLGNHKEVTGDRHEIFEQDYPELFAFVRRVSEETGTDFPRHIYLSPDVNAAVSFDSSFRSLFYRTPKNLTIGLGLVNMLDTSEFKAVLAHEFGHFSQKSMRAGSYVYYVNKAIHSTLYGDAGFGDVVRSFASFHAAFAIFATVTVKVVQVNQWILRKAYTSVNRQYLSLSREMEFHADAVAAHAAGSDVFIHALRRSEMADGCFGEVTAFYNERVGLNFRSQNFYSQQIIVAGIIAEELNLPLESGLPVLAEASHIYASHNRVVVKDQWASHPQRSEREKALGSLQIAGERSRIPAVRLFESLQNLHQQFTLQLYKRVGFSGEIEVIRDDQFQAAFFQARNKYAFPEAYAGFYDNRILSEFDPAILTEHTEKIARPEAFFREGKSIQDRIFAAHQDIGLLGQIADKRNGIATFDFDGTRYERKAADGIVESLHAEILRLEKQLVEMDAAACSHFLKSKSAAGAGKLATAYVQFYTLRHQFASNVEAARHTSIEMQVFAQATSVETAHRSDMELTEQCAGLRYRIEETMKVLRQQGEEDFIIFPTTLEKLRTKIDWPLITPGHRVLDGNFRDMAEQIQQFAQWSQDAIFSLQHRLLRLQLADD